MTTYAVTGASGGLGGHAVAALIARGISPADVVAIVRDESKAADLKEQGVTIRIADYTDLAALTDALTGVDRLLLVSSPTVGQRTQQHANVISAAKSADVGLLAYTSILRADTTPLKLAEEHVATEKLLAQSGLDHILLRNGWYWENYVGSAPAAIASGIFYGSAGEGKIAGAARADYADAAAAALIDGATKVYELAGDEHLTYSQIAATLADVSGQPVRYQHIPEADYAAALEQAGVPGPFAAILANADAGAAVGGLDSDATDLAELRGAASTPFVDVVRDGLTVNA